MSSQTSSAAQKPMVRRKKNPLWEYLNHNAGILIGLLVMCLIIIAFQPNFLNSKNLFNIMRSISITGILGFGMTLCIIINGIDLSRGSVVGLSSCFCAWVISNAGAPFWLAIVLSLCIGALCGFINGAFCPTLRCLRLW